MTAHEKPILMSAPMVRAILEGRKTQARPIVKWKPREEGINLSAASLQVGHYFTGKPDSGFVLRSMGGSCWNDRTFPALCPYGVAGDRLWVREAFSVCQGPAYGSGQSDPVLVYAADGKTEGLKYKPSIHMPRWASRVTLEITGVRVERLQEISAEDARAEGVEPWFPASEELKKHCAEGGSYRNGFRAHWESINGPGSWAANPWVWVLEFKRLVATDATGQ